MPRQDDATAPCINLINLTKWAVHQRLLPLTSPTSVGKHSGFVSQLLSDPSGTAAGEATDQQSLGSSCSITVLKLLQSALITLCKVYRPSFWNPHWRAMKVCQLWPMEDAPEPHEPGLKEDPWSWVTSGMSIMLSLLLLPLWSSISVLSWMSSLQTWLSTFHGQTWFYFSSQSY